MNCRRNTGVSRQTVRKALQILQNEGYIYAEHGRGTFCSEMLRHTTPSKNIAVVTTYLSDYIFPRIVQGIDQVLTENGYSILLKIRATQRSLEAKCLEELLQKGYRRAHHRAEQEPDFLPACESV